MTTPQPDKVMNAKETADLIGVSLRTLERMCKADRGPRRIRLSPGRVGFRLCDVAAWLEGRAAEAG